MDMKKYREKLNKEVTAFWDVLSHESRDVWCEGLYGRDEENAFWRFILDIDYSMSFVETFDSPVPITMDHLVYMILEGLRFNPWIQLEVVPEYILETLENKGLSEEGIFMIREHFSGKENG